MLILSNKNLNYKEMKKYTIIWDFDGTILPPEPYDSEQATLVHILNQTAKKIPISTRLLAKAIIYADMKEMFRRLFKKFFIHFLINTKIEVLDKVAEILAQKISIKDRESFLKLKEYGHDMMVISCGTADLSERILRHAGIEKCFHMIAGNRFKIKSGHIIGMDFHIPDPQDKLKLVRAWNISPKNCIVVGDGYTDRPLLDWAEIPVLIDKTGKKKTQYTGKKYIIISSINGIIDIVENNVT